jgi:small subunit ribosomal protein S17
MSEETVNAESTAAAAEGVGLSDDRDATATSETPVAAPQQMAKTIVVAVVRRVPHAKFGKIVKRTKKLYAHDEKNQCSIGDLVRIEETRPLSRLKRWQLVEVLKH